MKGNELKGRVSISSFSLATYKSCMYTAYAHCPGMHTPKYTHVCVQTACYLCKFPLCYVMEHAWLYSTSFLEIRRLNVCWGMLGGAHTTCREIRTEKGVRPLLNALSIFRFLTPFPLNGCVCSTRLAAISLTSVGERFAWTDERKLFPPKGWRPPQMMWHSPAWQKDSAFWRSLFS